MLYNGGVHFVVKNADMTLLSPSPFVIDGQDIALFPVPSELTVAQAAKILDMPEDCVNEFLDDGTIKFRLENGERLVQQDSFLEFESDYREGRSVLAELAQLGQEMGMYD